MCIQKKKKKLKKKTPIIKNKYKKKKRENCLQIYLYEKKINKYTRMENHNNNKKILMKNILKSIYIKNKLKM